MINDKLPINEGLEVIVKYQMYFAILLSKLNPQKWPPEVFYQKRSLRHIAEFTGKHLCQILFFNKKLRLVTLTKRGSDAPTQVFSRDFCELFKNTFSVEHLWATLSKPILPGIQRHIQSSQKIVELIYWTFSSSQ